MRVTLRSTPSVVAGGWLQIRYKLTYGYRFEAGGAARKMRDCNMLLSLPSTLTRAILRRMYGEPSFG